MRLAHSQCHFMLQFHILQGCFEVSVSVCVCAERGWMLGMEFKPSKIPDKHIKSMILEIAF